MSSTRPKPPGPTGLVSPGCYAAPLKDCDGEPLTLEHYISRKLLLRFPKGFMVAGLPWQSEPKPIGPKALTSRILCKRHNNALDPLDRAICDLFDFIDQARKTVDVPMLALDGEDLERWAIKVLVGLTVSGNAPRLDGKRERAEAIPLTWLRYLFGEDSLVERCGFYYRNKELTDFVGDLLVVRLDRWADVPGEPTPGAVFGITLRLANAFQYGTTFNVRWEPEPGLTYRPGGIQFGDPARGKLALKWDPPGDRLLVLKFP
jgi:hypothetical protein